MLILFINFNIIGITADIAISVYNIEPMEMFVDKQCVNIVQRILGDANHPITTSLSRQLPHHLTATQHLSLPKYGITEEPPYKQRRVYQQIHNPTTIQNNNNSILGRNTKNSTPGKTGKPQSDNTA